MHENYEDLENEFRYYSVKDMVEKTLQEIQKSMGLADTDIGALGRNFNSVMDAVNKATDIAIKIKNADLLNSLADLKIQIADIKLTLADKKDEVVTFREQNFELREENKSLKEQLELPLETRTVACFSERWYVASDTGHQHPICIGCYDSEKKIIHLTKAPLSSRKDGLDVKCPVCEHES